MSVNKYEDIFKMDATGRGYSYCQIHFYREIMVLWPPFFLTRWDTYHNLITDFQKRNRIAGNFHWLTVTV